VAHFPEYGSSTLKLLPVPFVRSIFVKLYDDKLLSLPDNAIRVVQPALPADKSAADLRFCIWCKPVSERLLLQSTLKKLLDLPHIFPVQAPLMVDLFQPLIQLITVS
jgi:hypothetical protein